MTWTLVWTDEAVRIISKLDTPVAARIVAKLESIQDDPPRHVKRLKGHDEFALRVGDYRVLLLLVGQKIIVTTLGHRSNVYGA